MPAINPGGRTSAQIALQRAMRDLCGQHAPEAVATLVRLLGHKDGRVAAVAATAILDRAIGKPQQSVDINATHQVQRAIDLSKLSNEELAVLQGLTRKAIGDGTE